MAEYTCNYPSFSVKELLKRLRGNHFTSPHTVDVILGHSIPTSVTLTATQPFYGGQRWWIVCPNTACSRRVVNLYLKNDELACRHCLGLTYMTKYYARTSIGGTLLAMTEISEIEKSGRRLIHGKHITRTGRRYMRLSQSFSHTSVLSRLLVVVNRRYALRN